MAAWTAGDLVTPVGLLLKRLNLNIMLDKILQVWPEDPLLNIS